MPNYPYTFQLPPLNVQDIPNDGVAGEFLGINGSGVLDWLTAGGAGDMLKADNLSGLTSYPTARTNLGLGTGDSPTFANLTLTSPSLVSSAPVTISQTWNGTGSTVFTALKVNAVSTASSTASLLLDLQVGGVSQFSIQRNGTLRMPGADPETKLSYSAAGFLFYGSGSPSLFIGQDGTGNGNAVMGNTGFIGFASAFTAASGNADTRLYRDAANTLALRNGANAQTFRVYNTYTDASNYERFNISFNSSRLEISTSQAGSGASRKIDFGTYGTTAITFFTNTINRWAINGSDGHFITAADNTYDIGASGASRPRNVYAGSAITAGGGITGQYFGSSAGGYFNWTTRSNIFSPADGVIRLANDAQTDFNRLQFGGTTNLFPAIKRSSTTLQARLADDSAFAPIQGKLTTDTAYTGTVVAATGYITIYDSTGAAYRVPCAV